VEASLPWAISVARSNLYDNSPHTGFSLDRSIAGSETEKAQVIDSLELFELVAGAGF